MLTVSGDEDGPALLARAGKLFQSIGDPLGEGYALACSAHGRGKEERWELFRAARKVLGDKGTEHYRNLLSGA